MHEDPRLGELRQHDRVAGPDHRLRVLQEHVERPRLALRVLPVIGDAAEDLAGPRQRRAQPHRGERLGLAFCREPLERRPQSARTRRSAPASSVAACALARLHRRARRPRARSAARAWARPLGSLKEHQLHDRSSFPFCGARKLARSRMTPPSALRDIFENWSSRSEP